MLHSLHKEASALLCEQCEAVQGNVCVLLFSKINGIFCIFVNFYLFLILIIFLFVTAQICDGDEIDDWEVKDHRTGESVPLRADRWFPKDPSADPAMTSGDFSGIRINIWNRAKVRRFITHFLAGGGTHNRVTML